MHFETKGKTNTKETIDLATRVAKERNIKHIVIASCTGYTCDFFKDTKSFNTVCVTHSYGFVGKGKIEMDDKRKEELETRGFDVLTTTHVLSGAERGLSSKFGGVYPTELIAHSLRMLGEGVKVGVEVATMALDSGKIPYGEKVVAIAGSVRGADSAVIITPAHAADIFETKIHEIICKPKNF